MAEMAPGEVVISARGVRVGYGDRLILEGLDLDVRRGEILGVVGASGTGKSVLMRTIIGLAPLLGGTIRIFGEDYMALPHAGSSSWRAGGACSSSTVRCSRP